MRMASLAAGEARLSTQDRELRLLEYAIAASIALHVLAFAALQWVTPRPERPATPAGPISARLVELAPAAPPAAAPTELRDAPAEPAHADTPPVPAPSAAREPAQEANARLEHLAQAQPREPAAAAAPAPKAAPQPEPRTEARAAPKPEPAAEPKPAPKAEPKPRPKRAPKRAAGTEAKPAAKPASDAATPPPGEIARAAPLPAPASSAPTIDEDVLAHYRLQLIGAARRYKRYPRAAMDNQWEGAAEVAMVVGANGRIREMTIASSSGHEVLDRQAIDMFRKAKPLVPIPAALRGREFRVTLKAIYSLREPGA